jgi:hypothetical protein
MKLIHIAINQIQIIKIKIDGNMMMVIENIKLLSKLEAIKVLVSFIFQFHGWRF